MLRTPSITVTVDPMKILVDVGNSLLKWAIASDRQLQVCGTLDSHGESLLATLAQAWDRLPVPSLIAIASVMHESTTQQVAVLARQLWPDSHIVVPKSASFECGVTNGYQQPAKLGIDRWLAIIAAYREYRSRCCIVDCGTALTVDFLGDEGRHEGGYIAPGLTLMKRALSDGTANLPYGSAAHPQALPLDTETGIDAGVLSAAAGFIEYAHKQRPSSRLILTGGDAGKIAQFINIPASIDDLLVFKGMLAVSRTEEQI